MARDTRDQRTRLNAEVAEQYGSVGKRRKDEPGRNALTNELDPAEPEVTDAPEAQDAEAAVETEAAAIQQAPPKKSVFELPRKQATPPPPPDDAPPSDSRPPRRR